MTKQPRLPDFIIVGAMRSGSTSLFRYLAGHPQVFVARTKELHYFDWHYDRGLGWYASHFAGAPSECVTGEATRHLITCMTAQPSIASLGLSQP